MTKGVQSTDHNGKDTRLEVSSSESTLWHWIPCASYFQLIAEIIEAWRGQVSCLRSQTLQAGKGDLNIRWALRLNETQKIPYQGL